MLLPLQLVFLLVFISHEPQAIAQYRPPYTSRVAPVHKHTDAAKPLYSVQMMTSWVNAQFIHENFLIDIDAPFPWRNCTLDWQMLFSFDYSCPTCTGPISCEEYQCTEVRTSYSYKGRFCNPVTNSSTLPGWGYCTCPVNVVNPVNGICSQAQLNYDGFTFNASNGRNPFPAFYDVSLTGACAAASILDSFPANVSGVMAFSTSAYALPAYLPWDSIWRNVYALCLPSSLSANGVMFFGNDPYYLLPNSEVDIKGLLSYTPLLNHPGSFGYYIGVTTIVIKGRSIDVSSENITTKLSTIEPYTTLRSDIYNSVVQRFSKVTKRIPTAKPIAPFGLCYNISINKTKAGINVPNIDLSLQGGKIWTISTFNSIKQITNDVACLAFVDGGATSEPAAIVIGTFQLEDNFLVFDLGNSTFGFSSSLLKKGTSCANFNFTTGSEPYP